MMGKAGADLVVDMENKEFVVSLLRRFFCFKGLFGVAGDTRMSIDEVEWVRRCRSWVFSRLFSFSRELNSLVRTECRHFSFLSSDCPS